MFKSNEKKVNPEELTERLDRLEKLIGFILTPAVTNLLDEALFNRTGVLGNNPLRIWISRKLLEPDLPHGAMLFLTEFLKTVDPTNYRPLRR